MIIDIQIIFQVEISWGGKMFLEYFFGAKVKDKSGI